ncbi:unnamed protein product [marine sediment metagenome]|uniref:DUF2061 domain-containing protein n=1 Tax=marine sediment metagenome TaxID=412755 RepID=X0WNB1_9ZZZZ
MDIRKKSIVKAITWRAIATITTMTIVFIVTGKLALAGVVGGFDLTIKLILYYLHERAWNKVSWGKK